MKLYSAKIDDIAKPVTEEVKKPRSEKQIAALERAKEARKRKREEIDSKKEEIKAKENEIVEAVSKKKQGLYRTTTPPFQCGQEETPSLTSEEEVPVKKSRKQPKPKQVEVVAPVEVVADPIVEQKPRKQREPKKVDEHEPPAWFKTFVANTRAEEAKLSKPKRPRQQVRQEAEEMAQNQWQDPHTRDRVNTQADNHMRKMHQLYGQIFRR